MVETIFHHVIRDDRGRVAIEAQRSVKTGNYMFRTGAGYSQEIEVKAEDLVALSALVDLAVVDSALGGE